MIKKIFFLPAARDETQKAKDWYEFQREGLGDAFELSLEACIESIKKHPEKYPKVLDRVRKGSVKRFPYYIIYIIDAEKVIILAVMHVKRNPESLIARLIKLGIGKA